jgi:hypothetical protein
MRRDGLKARGQSFIYTIPTGFESSLCCSNYTVALHRRAKVCVQQSVSHIVELSKRNSNIAKHWGEMRL